MNHLEGITNYFSAKAEERDVAVFEEKIKTDTVFAQEVATYLAQQNAIRQTRRSRVTDADRLALKKRLEESIQTEKLPFFVVYKKQFSIAAAVLLFAVGLLWVNKNDSNPIHRGTEAGTSIDNDTIRKESNKVIIPDSIQIDSVNNHK